MPLKEPPELTFQKHIAAFLVREHKYGVLDQAEITDTENFIVEDHLWAFLNDTQSELIKKLAEDYGTDARDEVFRALRNELRHTPLWLLIRNGLQVRGLEFRLYYPKPRSSESVVLNCWITSYLVALVISVFWKAGFSELRDRDCDDQEPERLRK